MEELQKAYKCADGKIFTSKDEALIHDKKVKFISGYYNFKMVTEQGDLIDPNILANWILRNRGITLNLLYEAK